MERALNGLYWIALRQLTGKHGDGKRTPPDGLLLKLVESAGISDIDRTFPTFSFEAGRLMNIDPAILAQVKRTVSNMLSDQKGQTATPGGANLAAQNPIRSPNFSRLLRWKNKHRSEECLLLCNGPSLNKVDFSRIDAKRFTFVGLNKIYLGTAQLGVQPKYIVAVNEKVLKQAAEVYSALPITKFIGNRVSTNLFQEGPFTFFINTTNLPKNHSRFSMDVVEYVHEGWTVTHAALQILYSMGFQRVFIVGMDHRFTQHVPGLENKAGVIEGDDLDHFHPGYFGNGQNWDYPDLKRSEESYRAARQVYEQDGREIIDCTIGGNCSIFKKWDIAAIYG
jgi:hypothetical protein